ncbi:SH3 domain-containing protein [Nostocales cyanobacterium LEGE 11386]|nr:SH3 domain-containing protein [Nostocales cyanobacterium LEGE 11386]
MYKNSSTWVNGLIQGANNTVNNIFHTGHEVVASITYLMRSLIPSSIQNNTNLLEVQNKYKVSLERLKIEQEVLKHQIETDGKLIELRNKEIELQKKALDLQQRFLSYKLSLIRQHHAENVQLKLQEFQNHWDVHRLPFSLSREETQKLFFPRIDRFWILLSPPKIENNIPEFRSLYAKVEDKIGSVIKKYYSTASDLYPVGFRQIFARPIDKIQAVHARDLLDPVPTLILSSIITEREVYMTLTLPNSVYSNNSGSDDKQISLPSWDWEQIKASLESTAPNSKENIHSIKELIAIIHAILAIYFCDVYCLSIDPYHTPKFFDFLQDSEFPEAFQKWVEPYQNSLLQLQESLRIKISSSNNTNNIGINNWKYTPAILTAIGVIFLLGMCNSISSHNSSEVEAVNASKKVAKISRNSGKSGVIKANYSGYTGVVLRVSPSIKAKEVSKLPNDEDVTLWELSDDGQWRKVTTNDGLSGWVWAKSVREKK